ncbi:MAG: nitroreductase family protein [Candidatus Peribacteraceae bacterium]
MNILKAIYNRRSIRCFTTQKPKRAQLESLIEAALQAPSAENSQPWHFTIVQEKSLREQITALAVEAGKHYYSPRKQELQVKFDKMGEERCKEMVERFTSGSLFSFLETAPALIAVSSEESLFAHSSSGAAIQNLMLAALELGLGTCWTGIITTHPKSACALQQLLDISPQNTFVALLAVGYPAQQPNARERKNVADVSTWF